MDSMSSYCASYLRARREFGGVVQVARGATAGSCGVTSSKTIIFPSKRKLSEISSCVSGNMKIQNTIRNHTLPRSLNIDTNGILFLTKLTHFRYATVEGMESIFLLFFILIICFFTSGHPWSLVVIRGSLMVMCGHSWSLVCSFRQDPI